MSKLYEFIERRKAELGLTTTALMEAGISSSTLHNIRHEKCYTLKESTMQKLAMVLQCSMGEIKAALAATDQVTEFGEIVKKGLPENETAADAVTDLPEEEPPAAIREDESAEQPACEPKQTPVGQKWYVDKPKQAEPTSSNADKWDRTQSKQLQYVFHKEGRFTIQITINSTLSGPELADIVYDAALDVAADIDTANS